MEPPFLPLDTEEQNQPPRLRDIPLRTLFPNIITLLAICSGLTGIRFAIEGRVEMALAAILLAAFLDGIDGRIARFLKSSTKFGAQMDSLADFVNFGVAPAMVLYFTILQELRPFGWVAALIYAMCACLRLARFNVQLENVDKPAFQQDFFVGVPAPAGAMLVLLPLYAFLLGVNSSVLFDVLAALYAIGIGYLMVSNIPTYSGKSIGGAIPRNLATPLILAAVIVVAILFSYPWATLTLAVVIYLAAIPLGKNYYHRLEERHAQNEMAKNMTSKPVEPDLKPNAARKSKPAPKKSAKPKK
jgi:CDP-diacylglycerol--serine O-phosphatidyltransferase